MATYVVSDIHGCYDEFVAVLDQVRFSETDELYVLGDVIDRGTQIDLCIDWLVRHRANASDSNVHFLMGNHEEMALWSFIGLWSEFNLDPVDRVPWEINGGTVSIAQMRNLPADTLDAFQRIVAKAPKAKLLRIGDERILLCHAGIRPAEPESEEGEWLIQADEDLLWIGTEWYCAEEQPPFDVVSGHTPVIALACEFELPDCPDDVMADGVAGRMMHWGRKYDIDCGCVFGGNLCLLRLEDKQAFYAARDEQV